MYTHTDTHTHIHPCSSTLRLKICRSDDRIPVDREL